MYVCGFICINIISCVCMYVCVLKCTYISRCVYVCMYVCVVTVYIICFLSGSLPVLRGGADGVRVEVTVCKCTIEIHVCMYVCMYVLISYE